MKQNCRQTLKINFTNIVHVDFFQYPYVKKVQTQSARREKLRKTLLCEKADCKILAKLNPSFKITNIL